MREPRFCKEVEGTLIMKYFPGPVDLRFVSLLQRKKKSHIKNKPMKMRIYILAEKKKS